MGEIFTNLGLGFATLLDLELILLCAAGVVIGILANIPVVNIIVGIVGGLIDLYILIGIVLSVLDYLKILK